MNDGALYHPDVIRRANGGHLFARGRIGGVIVSRSPGAVPGSRFRNRRTGEVRQSWVAVAMTAIGTGTGPGVYWGRFASEQSALAAARRAMLANGWYATHAEALAAVERMVAADPRV